MRATGARESRYAVRFGFMLTPSPAPREPDRRSENISSGQVRIGRVRISRAEDSRGDARLDRTYRRALETYGRVDAALELAADFDGADFDRAEFDRAEFDRAEPGGPRGTVRPTVHDLADESSDASIADESSLSTLSGWETLATIAAADVSAARIVEPHLDATSIIAEARLAGIEPELAAVGVTRSSMWGVFAAEGRDGRLVASERGGGWTLTGTKPWCSLAGTLSHALVTAHTASGGRRLFAVDLASAGVDVREGQWHAVGLASVPSGPVDFTDVAAVPVGDHGWYLDRPGFATGGMRVAAAWWGAAVGVARAVDDSVRDREPDQVATMHLGRLDIDLETARLALESAAAEIDAAVIDAAEIDGQEIDGAEIDAGATYPTSLTAHRVRGIVARTVDRVIMSCSHALGPAPLALDARHSRRVADLSLYVRQHHAERDDAALGRALIERGERSW